MQAISQSGKHNMTIFLRSHALQSYGHCIWKASNALKRTTLWHCIPPLLTMNLQVNNQGVPLLWNARHNHGLGRAGGPRLQLAVRTTDSRDVLTNLIAI